MDVPSATKRQSTDRGLSGLGLIMQLGGGIMAAVAAGYLAIFVIALLQSGGTPGDGQQLLWVLALLVATLARSLAHKQAGARLLFEGPGTPVSALGRYFVFAITQIVVICAFLGFNDAGGKTILAVILFLGAWPMALLLVARPMLDELGGDAPMAEDGGLDGVTILLLVFGAIGVGLGLIMLLGWLEIPSQLKSKMFGIVMLLVVGLLMYRSVTHVRAGATGTSAESAAKIFEAGERYANVGVTTGLLAGGLFVAALIQHMPGGQPMVTMMMLVMGAMVIWMLLVWPLALRRFVRHRELAALESNAALHARSPDRGLPTLGWLLLALGVFGLATSLIAVLFTDKMPASAGRDSPLSAMAGAMNSAGAVSNWLALAVASLETWAGLEMIRMRPHYRTAGMAYGFAAGAVALYTYVPLLGELSRESRGVFANPLAITGLATVATSLVIPIATLMLVQRKVGDRTSVADTFA